MTTMEYMGFRHGYQPTYGYSDPNQAHNGYSYITYEQQQQQQQQQMVFAQLHQQQRAAALMGHQGSMSQQKPTESKPRLAKDEVETLEREFQKNPKPNSSLKRELADQMRVDVARINNWFQNRRAKAKQIKKTQEFEALQAAERAASGSDSAEDQSEDGGRCSEFFPLSNLSQPMQASSAPFSDNEDSPEQPSDSPGSRDDYDAEDDASAASDFSPVDSRNGPFEDLEAPQFLQDDYNSSQFQFHSTGLPTTYDGLSNSCGPPHASETSQGPLPHHIGITIEDHSEHHGAPASRSNNYNPSQEHMSGLESFEHLANTEPLGSYPSSVPTFRPPFLSLDTDMNGHIKAEEASFNRRPSEVSCDPNHLSPISMTQASPTLTADLRFQPPLSPKLDIATRRNLRRPAQLNSTAFRTCSSGPKTGIDMPKRSEATSPMRRIASASGPLSGRIQKSMGFGPRSPMFPLSGRNQEALLQSALSPVTPSECFHAGRETTVASSASDDDLRYHYSAMPNPYFHLEAPHIKTPPGTPGFHQQPRYTTSNTLEAAGWNFMTPDEPQITPGLGSFGSEIEFPVSQSAPAYAASQPVTPSFARPAFYPIYTGNDGASNLEYKFPDSSSYAPESSARSSPVQIPASKNFQFTQNITPQDFNS